MTLATPPLALYVHFPWCVRKCPYCDFNSHPVTGAIPEVAYVGRVLDDLAEDIAWAGSRAIETVFLGGGTPSLVSPEAIARLLDGIRHTTQLREDAEITLEANPGAVDRGSFAGYRAAGVNRLSIGAQSFDPSALDALGRIHSADDTRCAVAAARTAGFESINLDLMHGLPHQTESQAIADLEHALALEPEHLSWYQLTIEPKTVFAERPPLLPDEDTLARIETAGFERLRDAGFERYEVSAFARTGQRARHNVNYWRFGDYIGIGAGAHGKLTFSGRDLIVRTTKPAQPRLYLAGLEVSRTERSIATGDRAGEFMLNALRLVEGVEPELFEARTGLALDTLEPARSRLIERDLMARKRLQATPLGLRYLDQVVAEFL